MKRILTLLPLCAALLGPALLNPQDPGPADSGGELRRDIFGRIVTKKAAEDDSGLDGMWQLLGMELEGYPPEGLNPFGYILFHKGFMAFELQAFYDEDTLDDDPFEDGYQTFMAEYELIGADRLVCRTLIGSYLDEEDDLLDYEDPGMEREFEIEFKGRLLTLEWDGKNWMTFGRVPPPSSKLKDIFGKTRGTRGRRGPDLFGREKTRAEEEEDGKGGD